ncbi:hypothetical protein FQN54_002277 [Arachnomyces sp. PD_36]|nr:hypothetical protein FQN54_002277 [Arachnomyces sp. PD_36]
MISSAAALLVLGSTLTSALTTWESAHEKAAAALAGLSNDDKAAITSGTGWMLGPCVGNTGSIESIGFPGLCLQDGPLGVRYAANVTAFPSGIHAASTWDKELIHKRGVGIGEESKGLGVNVQLGPASGPLGKIPAGGRNWEGFGPDPYLAGIAMAETITGMQGAGVQACAKHYILNEQEHERNTIDSIADDRTMHELYLWPFADAVKADVASVMCSYNLVNGSHACENSPVLQGLLKGELNFQGYVVSDWAAQHTTLGSANGGMDMTMPGDNFGDGIYLWKDALVSAVENGEVPQERLDDMAQRVLASWYFTEQDTDYPTVDWSSWDNSGNPPQVRGDHDQVSLDIVRDGTILLKNTDNALPLKSPASIAVIGQDGFANPNGPNACEDRGCDIGTLGVGWGSGTTDFPYLSTPYDGIKAEADAMGAEVVTSESDEPSQGASAAQGADVAIVFINADSGEEYIIVEENEGDRNDLNAWHNGNELVAAVAEANENTIVVIHSVGPIVLEEFIDLPSVKAVVWAGLPGQESGNGLRDILTGAVNPSGKLPFTIGKTAEDYGTAIMSGTDSFEEGLFVDYRHFDNAEIEPRFEFGFGLSYTTFNYSSIVIEGDFPADAELYDTVATVSATVANTGEVDGAEVAQLYIGLPSSAPDTPAKQLRGFQKAKIAAGEAATVKFELRKKDLSYWETSSQSWVVPEGEFDVYVGASSRDIKLTGKL